MTHRILPDEKIIEGFQRYDEKITKDYFYAICRKAYNIYDYKYQLRSKTGLDFYSLAHEYYIQLLQHEFRQLTDRPEGTPLATWMTGAFRYVVLEALKAYNQEFEALVDANSDEVVEYVRSSETDETLLPNVVNAVSNHYHDRTMEEIAHMVLYEGYKQKEVAQHLGITPAAVNQRYKKMMDEVVTPFVVNNYSRGIAVGTPTMMPKYEEAMPAPQCPTPTPHRPTPTPQLPTHASPRAMRAPSASPMRALFSRHSDRPMHRINRITPTYVTSLSPDEIFVFGSNLQGIHAGGAARTARLRYGAVMGQGVGLQGQSYAIPTMQGGVDTIRPYVDEFLAFAKAHPEWTFLVTPIGCGIAGFEPKDIAPLFTAAKNIQNITLPRSFWEEM